jgi:hypothetical protein
MIALPPEARSHASRTVPTSMRLTGAVQRHLRDSTMRRAGRKTPVAGARLDVESELFSCPPIACSRKGEAMLQPAGSAVPVRDESVSATPRRASAGQSAGLCASASTGHGRNRSR